MDWTGPVDQTLYAVQSKFYTRETKLETSTETLSVMMSSVVAMHDKVRPANGLLVLLRSIAECGYTFIIVHPHDNFVATCIALKLTYMLGT